MKGLPMLRLGRENNYVAFFLTFLCNLNCNYCINRHAGDARVRRRERRILSPAEWVRAANRLVLRSDLPLTLQGGEPTLGKAFYILVREARRTLKMDLLTNMTFDPKKFIAQVPVWRFTRDAPYAAIRCSYHPGQNSIDDLIRKTLVLQDAGFRVGLYSVLHPRKDIREHILAVQKKCLGQGIDFRTKEFLGLYRGRLYGKYRYSRSVSAGELKSCLCRTSELIVDPAGYIYRCHADLYQMRAAVAHILDESLSVGELFSFRNCDFFGDCNPCDVKVKTNRFQIYGHTSVEILPQKRSVHGRSLPHRRP